MKIKFGQDEIELNLPAIEAVVISNKTEGINYPLVRQFSRADYAGKVEGLLSSRVVDNRIKGMTMDDSVASIQKDALVFPDAPSLSDDDQVVRDYIQELYLHFPCYIGEGFMDGGNLYWGNVNQKQPVEFDVY